MATAALNRTTGEVAEDTVLADLRRPFTPAAVKFKIQAGKMVVAYIDARLVTERLNKVCGFGWNDDYEPVPGGLECTLTVFGDSRRDVGIAESSAAGGPKALYSDAFKRAAVKFGVGVSLYATPRMFVRDEETIQKNGKIVGIKDAGIARFRREYAAWLDRHGIQAFGEPLDHGDVDDAQGDAEVESAEEPKPTAAQDTTTELVSTVAALLVAKKGMTPEKAGEVAGSHADDARWLRRAIDQLEREPDLEREPEAAE